MQITHWQKGNLGLLQQASDLLLEGGKAIVTPTKVGYIIIALDKGGLERKFTLKARSRKKPSVVLASSLDELEKLAQLTDKIYQFYQACENQNILLGCILPWKNDAREKYLAKDELQELVMDSRKTSCFVIGFGEPSEIICTNLWKEHGRLVFASSANPSGKGNRGQLRGVGEQILNGVDMIIEADDYVASQQPHSTITTRYEQGVMVSMVNEEGKLTDVPMVIRKGLDVDKIMLELSKIWTHFDYRHGAYY